MKTELVPQENKTLKMTFEEFDVWSFQQTVHNTEWVNGEAIYKAGVSTTHQRIILFLSQLFDLYIQLFKLGDLSSAPVQIRINDTSVREPDLFFIANDKLHLLSDKRLDGAPTLIVEVVSDGSVKLDRETKWKEYQEAGVSEYWIIDPRPGKERADFYRQEDGGFVLVATEDDDKFESEALQGFWLQPSWLWKTTEIQPLVKMVEITGLSFDEIGQKLSNNT